MKKSLLLCSLLVMAMGLVAMDPPGTSVSPTPEYTDFSEVLKKADFHRGGQVEGISWNVEVIDIEGEKIVDEITLFVEAASEGQGERQYSLINFQAPKKYEGRKFLVKDNSMWFKKAGLKAPVPISGRERLSGQASNTDVASVNYYHDYSIEETAEGEAGGKDCWILTLKAKNNLVSYSSIKYWVSKDTNHGLRAEYYGTSGKQIKYADFEYNNKVTHEGTAYDYISKSTIYDLIIEGNYTTLDLSEIKFPKHGSAKFQKDNI